MELITLWKGKDSVIVEKGSQGEKEMRAVGYTDKKVVKSRKRTK